MGSDWSSFWKRTSLEDGESTPTPGLAEWSSLLVTPSFCWMESSSLSYLYFTSPLQDPDFFISVKHINFESEKDGSVIAKGRGTSTF